MKQDVWKKILENEELVKEENSRPIFITPYSDFKEGDKIICLYEPNEIFKVKTINPLVPGKQNSLNASDNDNCVLRTFYFDSIIKVEDAEKLYKSLNKEVYTFRRTKEICKNCGREKEDHNASNFSCPLGRKLPTLSFTQFSTTQVFELKVYGGKKGRKSSGVYEFLEELLEKNKYSLEEITVILKEKYPEKKTPAYNVLYDLKKRLKDKVLELDESKKYYIIKK